MDQTIVVAIIVSAAPTAAAIGAMYQARSAKTQVKPSNGETLAELVEGWLKSHETLDEQRIAKLAEELQHRAEEIAKLDAYTHQRMHTVLNEIAATGMSAQLLFRMHEQNQELLKSIDEKVGRA